MKYKYKYKKEAEREYKWVSMQLLFFFINLHILISYDGLLLFVRHLRNGDLKTFLT